LPGRHEAFFGCSFYVFQARRIKLMAARKHVGGGKCYAALVSSGVKSVVVIGPAGHSISFENQRVDMLTGGI
jgi:hypothetical protein